MFETKTMNFIQKNKYFRIVGGLTRARTQQCGKKRKFIHLLIKIKVKAKN